MGDFALAREYATIGLQIWTSGSFQGQIEEVTAHPVALLFYDALSQWHLGETAACQVTIARAISLAKELTDIHGLAVCFYFAAVLAQFEHRADEVERVAMNIIELSTRQNFALWLATGKILRGWARSVFGDTEQGILWINEGLEDTRATGTLISLQFLLSLKAEALHLADRTSEALAAVKEAEALVEKNEERWWSAELHRLRGVFLADMGAEESQIEALFCEAIRIAKEQKSVSLEKRSEATHAEYRRQKASGSGGCGFRLPLW
jgi:predicted ATPase